MSSQLFLLKELVRRDFQGRYVGSLLGFVWAFVQPLWQLILYSFVFSTVLNVRVSSYGDLPVSFGVFLFCGLLPWMAIHEGVVRSATAITDNADLVKKMRFPPLVLLVAAVIGGLLHELIAAVIFVLVLAATGQMGWQGLPLLLAALPLQAGLTLGLGLVLCCVHTLFRDTALFLNLFLTGWFFLTPIVYPLDQVPKPYSDWLLLNPLTTLVGMYRQALLADEMAWLDGTGALFLLVAGLLAVGLWLFRRLQPTFADEI